MVTAAQLAKAHHFLGDFILEQDLPVGITNFGLVIDDQNPGGR
jgi:hypothetical protein